MQITIYSSKTPAARMLAPCLKFRKPQLRYNKGSRLCCTDTENGCGLKTNFFLVILYLRSLLLALFRRPCLAIEGNKQLWLMLRRCAAAGKLMEGIAGVCTALNFSQRNSMSKKIANRRSVERFHATRFIEPTRLAKAAPLIAEEWDFERNPMHVYPKLVGVGSLEKYWWACKGCGHSFEASPEKRVLRGYSCPRCDLAAKRAAEEQTHKESLISTETAGLVLSTKKKKRRTKRGSLKKKKQRSGKLSFKTRRNLRRRLPSSSKNASEEASSQQTNPTIPRPELLPGERSLAFSPKNAPMFTNRFMHM